MNPLPTTPIRLFLHSRSGSQAPVWTMGPWEVLGPVCRALQVCFARLAHQPEYRIGRGEICCHTLLTFFSSIFVWVNWDSLARFNFLESLFHTQSLTVVLNWANLFKSNSFAIPMTYRLIRFTRDHEACPVMLRCPRQGIYTNRYITRQAKIPISCLCSSVGFLNKARSPG